MFRLNLTAFRRGNTFISLVLIGCVIAVLLLALLRFYGEIRSTRGCQAECFGYDVLWCRKCDDGMKPEAQPGCKLPLYSAEECNRVCPTACALAEVDTQGLRCFSCENLSEEPVDAKPQDACPEGSSMDKATCEKACGNGVCSPRDVDGLSCFECLNCPAHAYANLALCESACDADCALVGAQGDLQCWQCKPSCEELCRRNGMSTRTDFTAELEAELQQWTCVSGADIRENISTLDGCTCAKPPTLLVDKKPFVCKNTPCGDVPCNQEKTCDIQTVTNESGSVTQQATVNCAWGGWENIAPNQFRINIGKPQSAAPDAPARRAKR